MICELATQRKVWLHKTCLPHQLLNPIEVPNRDNMEELPNKDYKRMIVKNVHKTPPKHMDKKKKEHNHETMNQSQ